MNARRIFVACLLVPALSGLAPCARAASGEAFPVSIQVEVGASRGELRPIWRFFGADEPNYAYMKEGRKLLAALGHLGTPQVYFRTHNLLNTGDGAPALKWGSTNAYTEDAQGRAVYDRTIFDRIFDAYLQRGLKRMGAPIAPNAEQYAQLLASSQLAWMEAPPTLRVENGQASLRFVLPRQAVSLVVLEW